MTYTYRTHGVCSRAITFEIDDNGILHNVQFDGGCNGNTKGIGRLVEGRNAEEVSKTLAGVTCGPRPTSCPDQLSIAIKQALGKE
ncbi:MAG: TIGR03905 family TSCPD domain-containing protein [Clostridia bacterium]|nr:TIGR03905 family TSCPD domain-containing protein [Clostridia bacterium]